MNRLICHSARKELTSNLYIEPESFVFAHILSNSIGQPCQIILEYYLEVIYSK